jgi:hypothetical protein
MLQLAALELLQASAAATAVGAAVELPIADPAADSDDPGHQQAASIAAQLARAPAVAALGAAAGGGGTTAAALLPLLRLASGAGTAAVREAAEKLLVDRLAPLCGNREEVLIWVGCLPMRHALSGDPHAAACGAMRPPERGAWDAVLSFMSDAAAAAARRPQEFHEVAQRMLQQQPRATPPMSDMRAVPPVLPVAALRHLLRLLGSTKIAGPDKAAICGYVCGAWAAWLEQWPEPGAAACVLEGMLAAQAHAPGRQQQQEQQLEDATPSKKKRKTGGAAAVEQQRNTEGSGAAVLQLPAEGATLVSLLAHARALAAAAAAPTATAAVSQKRRGAAALPAPVQLCVEAPADGAAADVAADLPSLTRWQLISQQLLSTDAAAAAAAVARALSATRGLSVAAALQLPDVQSALFAARAHALVTSAVGKPGGGAQRHLARLLLEGGGGAVDALLLVRASLGGGTADAVGQPQSEGAWVEAVKQAAGQLRSEGAGLLVARAAACAAGRAAAARSADGVDLAFWLLDSLVFGDAGGAGGCDWGLAAALLRHPALLEHSGGALLTPQTHQLAAKVLHAATPAGGSGHAGGVHAARAAAEQHVQHAVSSIEARLEAAAGAPSLAPSAAAALTAELSLLPFAQSGQIARLAAILAKDLAGLASGQQVHEKDQKQRRQQQQQAAGTSSLPAWLADVLVAVASLTLGADGSAIAAADAVARQLFDAVQRLFLSRPSPALEACLAAALRPAAAPFALLADEQLVGSCMVRLTPEGVALLARLVEGSPKHRAAFVQQLQPCIAAAAEAGGAAARRGALALLLPAAEAALRHAAGPSMDGSAESVAAVFREPLLAYMQRKRRKQQAQAERDEQLPPGALPALRLHALRVLLLCLEGGGAAAVAAGSDQQLLGLLPKLLPAAGWDPAAEDAAAAATNATSSAAVATAHEQARFAAWIVRRRLQQLEQLEQEQQQPDVMEEDQAASLQLLDERTHLLGSYLAASSASLAAAYRQAPADAQTNGLQGQLAAALDGWVGDAVADLPDAARAGPAFCAVLSSVQRLAVATLKHRMRDAAALRRLRRLLAALLPAGVEEEEEEGEDMEEAASEQQEQQQPDGLVPDADHMDVDDQISSSSSTSSSDDDDDSSSEQSGASQEEEEKEREQAADAGTRDLKDFSSDDEAAPADQSSEEEPSSSADALSSDDEEEGAEGSAAGAVAAGQAGDGGGGEEEAAAYEELAYLDNPEASNLAAHILTLLISHSHFLPTVLGGGSEGEEDGSEGRLQLLPLRLPAAMARVATPLGSLAPVIDALFATADAAAGRQTSSQSDSAGAPGQTERLDLKQELAVLLEVLLDVKLQFAAGPSLDGGDGDQEQHAAAAAGGDDDDEARMLRPLLKALLVGYHGTMHPTDAALLRVIMRVDHMLACGGHAAAHAGRVRHFPPAGAAAAAAALAGAAAAESGYLFGPAARALFDRMRGAPHGDAAAAAACGGASTPAPAMRMQLLRERFAPDPLRCALTVVLFPDAGVLCAYAPADDGGSGGGGGSGASSAGMPDDVVACAYDPRALLPLAALSLRDGAMDAGAFVSCGLLGVCLRALAASDPGLRWVVDL